MKKLLLSLLCVGSILALPGCWCCRKSCEPTCQEECDAYDDYCDEGHYGCGKEDYCDDDREVVAREEQGGRTVKKYYRKKGEQAESKGPRKIMYKPVYPGIIEGAEAKGGQCKLIDPRFHKENKRMNKEARQTQEAPVKRASRKSAPSQMMENEGMDLE